MEKLNLPTLSAFPHNHPTPLRISKPNNILNHIIRRLPVILRITTFTAPSGIYTVINPPYSLLLVMVFGIQQGYFENLHPFSSFKLFNIYAQKPPNRLCFKTSSCFSCLRRNLLTARFKNLLPDVEQCFFFNRHALQWQIPIPVDGSFILYTFYQVRSLIKSNNHICIFLAQNHIIQRTNRFC